jgi:hypothetical protein
MLAAFNHIMAHHCIAALIGRKTQKERELI